MFEDGGVPEMRTSELVVGASVGCLVDCPLNVGDAESTTVGPALGDTVGDPVGALVDIPVGNLVGFPVGDDVGALVGPAVGDTVGKLVVGAAVGCLVGCPLNGGDPEPTVMGPALAAAVGDSVDALVGIPVGNPVGFRAVEGIMSSAAISNGILAGRVVDVLFIGTNLALNIFF